MPEEKRKYDWIIHVLMNGMACDDCGEITDDFIHGACDVHTHGLDKFGHLEFQAVLPIDPKINGTILNDLGERVKNGEKYHGNMYVEGIIHNFPIYLEETVDAYNKPILRVIYPDPNGRFPDDEDCEAKYKMQKYPTPMLYKNKNQSES